MRRLGGVLIVGLGIGALLAAVSSCGRDARAADVRVVVTELLTAAPGDTARYRVTWTAAPVTTSSPAATAWHLRLLGADTTKDSLGDYRAALVSHQLAGSRFADTVAVALPATFTDSVGPLSIAVRGVNQFGPGAWARTSRWYAKRKGLPPGQPLIIVDSSLSIRIDTLYLRPAVVAMTPGTPVQLCPMIVQADGQRGAPTWWAPPGGGPDTFFLDTSAYCQSELTQWLTERPA